MEALRIFVGTDDTQLVAHQVLAYSIRKSSSIPVEITPMLDYPTPMPRDPANQPGTKFSFCRFLIPELCGYQGRALYLDADMLVFGDVAELAALPFAGKRVLCTNQPEAPAEWHGNPHFRPGRHLAVMLLDCERLSWDVDEVVGGLDRGAYTYRQLMDDLCIVDTDDVGETVPTEWNHLERYEPGVTKLLHFTVAPMQPWKNDRNPLAPLWMEWYREAVEAGAISASDVRRMIASGKAKKSLRPPRRLLPSFLGRDRSADPAGVGGRR